MRLTITLTPAEFDSLRSKALTERRFPRDQASYLLAQILRIPASPDASTLSPTDHSPAAPETR